MKISATVLRKLKHNNAHVADYLDAYRRMGRVDFAVMITGPWGSGKTEFVKSWVESLSQKDNDDKPDALSVSLNGVSTIDEIDSLLFRAAHPVLGGKSARIAGKVLTALAAGIKLSSGATDAKVGLEFSAGELKDISFDKWIGDAPLLVFDDLERCCIDIESLMGYFDDLLQNGKKVILVCAENEIENRWKEDSKSGTGRTLPSYAEICSKIIGKRFHIEAEIEDLYGVLVAQAECAGFLGKFLIAQRDVFIHIFKAVGEWAGSQPNVKRRIYNYRAYKHALRDLSYWFGKLPRAERENEGFLLDFSRAFVLIDYALLSGALKPSAAFHSGGDLDTRTEFEKLMDLGGVAWNDWDAPDHDVGVPASMMKRMIFNELVSADELRMGVHQSRYFSAAQHRNEWQQLLEWNRLEDAQLKELMQTLLQKIATFAYTKAEEVLHVFSLLGEMAAYKIYARAVDEVTADCKKYVERLVADDRLDVTTCEDVGCLGLEDHGMGFQYSGAFDEKPYFTNAHDIVKTAVQEVSSKRRTTEIHEMQDEFGKYPGRFYSALQDPSSHFCREPVFDQIDVGVFYRAYCTLSNVDKNNVGRILYARAKNGTFEVESDFWKELILLLKTDVNSIAGAAMPPSVFQKKMLAEQLANVINYTGEMGQRMVRRID